MASTSPYDSLAETKRFYEDLTGYQLQWLARLLNTVAADLNMPADLRVCAAYWVPIFEEVMAEDRVQMDTLVEAGEAFLEMSDESRERWPLRLYRRSTNGNTA